jgi:hypothetical protein
MTAIELIGSQIARTRQVLATGPNALQTLTSELRRRGESDLASINETESSFTETAAENSPLGPRCRSNLRWPFS